ncbi:unnamed protein product [Scytosiphon promiscuus]
MVCLRRHGGPGLRFAAFLASAIFSSGYLALSSAQDFDGSSYYRNVSMDANLDMFWTIDSEAATIRVAVHAKSTSGWVGIGMSEMGGMEGADILYFESSTGNITDAYSIVAGTPIVDECTQDWTLLSAEVVDGSIVFEAERALDTGDVQDRVFEDDTREEVSATQLISAWGDTDVISYHDSNFAKVQVVMFGNAADAEADEALVDIKDNADIPYFDVGTKNFDVPEITTWYEYTCFPGSEMPQLDEYHAIGFEALPQANTTDFVHHMILTGWYGPTDCGNACIEWLSENLPDSSDGSSSVETASVGDESTGPTSSSSSPSSFSSVSAMLENSNITAPSFCENFNFADIYIWAPGSINLELPEDVGFLLGNSSSGFSSMSLQTHYNNPNGVAGVQDSSSVRVYYSEELRPMNMGVIRLGDPNVVLDQTPIPDGRSQVLFDCPGSCTEENFEVEEVDIFYHGLHMHENGKAMRTRHYREDDDGNEVLLDTASVEYYDYLQAGGYWYRVNDSITLRKGDRFETECFYDTSFSSIDSSNVTFGFGSEEEMCVDFIYYYPDQKMPSSGSCGLMFCGGSLLELSALPDDSDFNRTFGFVDTCTASEDGDEVTIESSAAPELGPFVIFATVLVAFFVGSMAQVGVSCVGLRSTA